MPGLALNQQEAACTHIHNTHTYIFIKKESLVKTIKYNKQKQHTGRRGTGNTGPPVFIDTFTVHKHTTVILTRRIII